MAVLKFSSGLTNRFLVIASLFTVFFVSLIYLYPSARNYVVTSLDLQGGQGDRHPDSNRPHPIDRLIAEANEEWQYVLAKRTHDVENAADRYRARRGRHPPPGFAEWFEFAQERNAVIVEDFFDQIYDDLSPYWGIDPKKLRQQASGFHERIIIRNHTAKGHGGGIWKDSWLDMVTTIQEYLPDLDMPLNMMDESRIITPWEEISDYVRKDHASRILLTPEETLSEYMTLPDPDIEPPEIFDPSFVGGNFWDVMKVGCPTDSPSQNSHIPSIDFANPPPELYNYLNFSQDGYIKNWTLSKDPCFRPELQALHGTFIEPISISTTHELIPLFGGSKLPMNNEILIPAAMYWADDERYSGGKQNHGGKWDEKEDKLVWRGAASGGRNRETNWTGFQRHRFISMLNGTSVQEAEKNGSHHLNFILPDYTSVREAEKNGSKHPDLILPNYNAYDPMAGDMSSLPEFLDDHTDVAFVHLTCFPATDGDLYNPYCSYTGPYFSVAKPIPMKEMYTYKYLPDIDGNSFSGRYRGFLLSTSLPIKATIYNEWHDSRLMPWVHFVPMDSTYMDIYGIMEYFIGQSGRGHDAVARTIAFDGKSWAEKALREQDMQIYVYRLLLEYARICDDRREMLGYVDDLARI